MDCRECAGLVERYERVERLYASAIDDLTARKPGGPVSEYRRLRKVADDARLEAETARLALRSTEGSIEDKPERGERRFGRVAAPGVRVYCLRLASRDFIVGEVGRSRAQEHYGSARGYITFPAGTTEYRPRSMRGNRTSANQTVVF
jgi:hypothetical protein